MSRIGVVRALTLGIALALVAGLALVILPRAWDAISGADAGSPGASAGASATGTASPTPAPTPTTAPLVLAGGGSGAGAGAPSSAGVATALADALSDSSLGSARGVAVAGIEGALLLDEDAQGPRTPASTAKILTAVAALTALGPDTRFTTSVELAGPGSIVLVGGGDPALSQRERSDDTWTYPVTSLQLLAQQTADALLAAGVASVTLGYRADLFTGPDVSPDWSAGYVSSGQVGPVSALAVDGGREQPGQALRSDDPTSSAARVFAELLREAGIAVPVPPTPALSAGQLTAVQVTAVQISAVQSPTVADLVVQLLERSDNDVSEVLARHVARAMGEEASFAGLGRAVPAVLAGLGLRVDGLVMDDGSGLSRGNLVSPETLVASMQVALDPDHPELSAVATGLPVAGFTGTLEDRFGDDQSSPQVGDIRAKTGYLNGVVALAGYVVDDDGVPLVFAVLADGVDLDDTLDAQRSADRVAAALAGCGCT